MIDPLDMADTIERCDQLIQERGSAQHISINAAKLVLMRKNSRLRRIIADATIVGADGQSVVWASRLLGKPLPERVAGIDLMFELLGLAERRRYRVFLLGAASDVIRDAASTLQERYPKLPIAGYHHGYFSDDDTNMIIERIRASRSQILLVGMGSPQKEFFIAENSAALGIPLAVGVGGSFDVVAGRTKRAPVALQRVGLEWFYRWSQEPRRLTRRYLVTNSQFLWLLARASTARGVAGCLAVLGRKQVQG
jgi:N-acetylglucosaminyldiphosphoundecaprenol N-acetyl-beta-D-mannosaminyltransferase